jgi:serine/threonine protein kinase
VEISFAVGIRMSNLCPDRATLVSLLNGTLANSEQVEAHLESCAACCQRLEEYAGMAAVVPKTALPPELRRAQDSQRLHDLIAELRHAHQAPPTAVGGPRTDVAPIGSGMAGHGGTSRRPQRIGDYDVQAVLGRGGIGVVYRATDSALARDVAIKVLRADLADDESLRERFLREARAAAALRHDHVVAIYGVNQHGEQPYLVMEYVPGGSLADRVLRKGRLPWIEVVRLGIEVASSLAAAHARGIIHRDVKPGNVLWDAEAARYKLTDFGLAKAIDDTSLTRSGTLVGTPEFLSPEQAEGGAVDARSDLFSLGAMLYAAATGQSPFYADSTMGVLHRVRTHAPPNLRQARPDCPSDLASLVARLLAKDPKNRIATASAVVDELRRIENGHADSPSVLSKRRRDRASGRPLLAAAAAIIAIVALVVSGIAWLTDDDAERSLASGSPAAQPDSAFLVTGISEGFDTLAAAVSAAPSGGTIEIRDSRPFSIDPIRIEGKPLLIRAARGSRAIIVPASAKAAADAALTTDSDLTLEGLVLRWGVDPTEEGDAAVTAGGSAIRATGGMLRINHCELSVGSGDACLRLAGARSEVANTRLSARRGACVAWRPRAANRLQLKNCVLSGDRCISIDCEDRRGDLPAILESSETTWRGRSALELVIAFAPLLPLEVRTNHNLFAVDHTLVMYWPRFGPLSKQSPDIDNARPRLRRTIDWQESENLYGEAARFVSYRSPRQSLRPVKDSPNDIAAWEAFWNRPASGSQRGTATPELRGKVGANESNVGPTAP